MDLKYFFITLVTLSLIGSSLAFAGNYYHGHGFMMPSGNMNEMDSDQSGTLSFSEYVDSQQKKLRAGFDMIDSNKDGEIDADEWNAFLEVHGVKAEE